MGGSLLIRILKNICPRAESGRDPGRLRKGIAKTGEGSLDLLRPGRIRFQIWRVGLALGRSFR